MTVLQELSPDHYRVGQTVATGVGHKPIGLDEMTGRIYLPTGRFGPNPAPTAKTPHPLSSVIPGSFEVLVFRP